MNINCQFDSNIVSLKSNSWKGWNSVIDSQNFVTYNIFIFGGGGENGSERIWIWSFLIYYEKSMFTMEWKNIRCPKEWSKYKEEIRVVQRYQKLAKSAKKWSETHQEAVVSIVSIACVSSSHFWHL